jgi:ubiquinone/menaquinone biosynthesis C-methylase UbiE
MSFLDEKFLDAIQNDLTESEMYVVRPETEATFNLKNAIYLQGDHKNIPLKAKYIDLLIVEGLPDDQDFSKAINEWLRVLKDNGIVILIAPKSAFSKFKDPLTIGEFMEKIEYKNLSKRKVGNGLAFKQLLEKAFLRVQKREILNMIFLTAVELR